MGAMSFQLNRVPFDKSIEPKLLRVITYPRFSRRSEAKNARNFNSLQITHNV